MKKLINGIMAVSILLSVSFAQTAQEAVDLFQNENGFGLRAAAMGNAYTSVADDYSAIYWNPAGLAQLKFGEMSGALMHSNFSNDVDYFGKNSSDSRTFTKLQNFGIAYPFPVARGSFVVAFGYQKVNNLDSFTGFKGTNNVGDLYDVEYEHTFEGSIDQWSFAVAMDLSENFSAGLTMNFIGGSKTFSQDYLDDDLPYYFDNLLYREKKTNLDHDYSGFNLQLGGLFKLSDNIKMGAKIGRAHV